MKKISIGLASLFLFSCSPEYQYTTSYTTTEVDAMNKWIGERQGTLIRFFGEPVLITPPGSENAELIYRIQSAGFPPHYTDHPQWRDHLTIYKFYCVKGYIRGWRMETYYGPDANPDAVINSDDEFIVYK